MSAEISATKQAEMMPIVDAVEAVLGKRFHAVTIRRWNRQGKLKCLKVGKEWFCSLEAVRAMVKQQNPEA